jgi:hypothetical protein
VGEEERIQEWHRVTVEKLSKAGEVNWANKIVVIAQDGWELAEINKFINNTGSIGLWMKRNLPEMLTQPASET